MDADYHHLAHIAFILLALSYVIRDILWLRAVAVTAAIVMIAFNVFAYPQPISVVIGWNIAFIFINVCHIAILLKERADLVFSDDEEELRRFMFGTLPAYEFRKLMQAAQWREADAGDVLIVAGEPVDELVLLISGRAHVELDGQVLATLSDGAIAGEMSYLTGELPCATVRFVKPSKYVSFPVSQLRALVEHNSSLRDAIQVLLAGDVVNKLKSYPGMDTVTLRRPRGHAEDAS